MRQWLVCILPRFVARWLICSRLGQRMPIPDSWVPYIFGRMLGCGTMRKVK